MHVAHDPESSLHSKLESASLEVKAKVAVLVVVRATGPLTIVVCGGVVSAAAASAEGAGEEVSVGAAGAGPEVRETPSAERIG